ncbi:MAG: response regulator transcription factor [Acidobacteria bacterium]|nr:response regulator transcription factor [Acidobacteriota bacterium]
MSAVDHPIRVSVVEDDKAWRLDLERLIRQAPGLVFVSAYANAEAALRGLPLDAPEVVLVDVQLPRLSGVACVARLKPRMPATQFMMLSAFDDTEQVLESLRVGATGYLLKTTPPGSIQEAITELHQGSSPMSGHIARKVVESFRRPTAVLAGEGKLTAREQEILQRLATGDRYKEIADRLQISVLTVRTHIRHIYEKLHVQSRTEATLRFLRSSPPGDPPG